MVRRQRTIVWIVAALVGLGLAGPAQAFSTKLAKGGHYQHDFSPPYANEIGMGVHVHRPRATVKISVLIDGRGWISQTYTDLPDRSIRQKVWKANRIKAYRFDNYGPAEVECRVWRLKLNSRK